MMMNTMMIIMMIDCQHLCDPASSWTTMFCINFRCGNLKYKTLKEITVFRNSLIVIVLAFRTVYIQVSF